MTSTNVLSGVPSIIVGIFAYGAIVLRTDSFSAFAGGFALAILMLPIIVRTTDEALQIVPQEVRWASVGVGASNFHTVLKIVLPAALPAIVTGTTLAIARAAGETGLSRYLGEKSIVNYKIIDGGKDKRIKIYWFIL